MRALAVKLFMGRVFAGLSRGRTRLALLLMGDRVRFRFPGEHSFSADYDDPADVAAWMERLAAFRPRLQIDDVAVAGPPWNMRAFMRYRDWIDVPPHGGPYANEICSFVRIRWVKVVEYQVYLDTQRVAEHFGPPAGAGVTGPSGGRT